MSRPPAELRQLVLSRSALWVAILVAVGGRLVYWSLFGTDIANATDGDGVWYWGVARNLAEHGLFAFDPAASAPDFFRPPGFPALLAAIFLIAGEQPFVAFAVLALVSASGVWLLGRIAAELWGADSPFVTLAYFLYALDPVQAAFPSKFLSESVLVPMTLGFAWLCLRALRKASWPRLVALSLAGALLVHFRLDLVALVLLAPPVAALIRWRTGTSRGFEPRWLACALLSVALCVPWAAFASRQSGELVMMAESAAPGNGFHRWLLTVPLSLGHWVEGEWEFDDGGLPPELYPSSVFSSVAEESEARAMMAETRSRGAPTGEIQQRFAEMAARKVAEAPLRYYAWLPLRRSFQLWLHFEKGCKARWPDLFAEPGWRHAAYSLVNLPFVALALAGFLLCWLALARFRGGLALLAALVLGRTYSLALAGLAMGRALFEVRYLTPVQPLAILLAGSLAVALLAALSTGRDPAVILRRAWHSWSGGDRDQD